MFGGILQGDRIGYSSLAFSPSSFLVREGFESPKLPGWSGGGDESLFRGNFLSGGIGLHFRFCRVTLFNFGSVIGSIFVWKIIKRLLRMDCGDLLLQLYLLEI